MVPPGKRVAGARVSGEPSSLAVHEAQAPVGSHEGPPDDRGELLHDIQRRGPQEEVEVQLASDDPPAQGVRRQHHVHPVAVQQQHSVRLPVCAATPGHPLSLLQEPDVDAAVTGPRGGTRAPKVQAGVAEGAHAGGSSRLNDDAAWQGRTGRSPAKVPAGPAASREGRQAERRQLKGRSQRTGLHLRESPCRRARSRTS